MTAQKQKIILIISTCFLILLFFLLSASIVVLIRQSLQKGAEIFVAEYQTTKLKVDASSNVGFVEPVWAAISQGGEEAGGMLTGTEELIEQVNPKYIRLDHIFDDDYYGVYSSGTLEWSKLDKEVESMIAMGAKPFFSLSYFPKAISSTKIDVPYDWGKWSWLVEQIIKHYSGEKGIEDIYYEVWNEPDLESFGSWKYYGDKSYLTLYDYSARGALNARNAGVKSFKIGGPAITALYANWVTSLTNYCNQNGLPLDFISWHRYAYSPTTFIQDLGNARAWAGGRELVISEWGPDPGKTAIYSGYYSAAHAVAVVSKMIEKLNLGFLFEVKDGPSQGDYGWGLLTHNNAGLKAKPRYYALSLIKDMIGSRLDVSGEGSNIYAWAVGNQENIKLILSNFAVAGANEEEFPIVFTNLKSGEYRIQWESLQSDDGNKVVKTNRKNEIAQKAILKANDVMKVKITLLKQIKNNNNESGSDSGLGRIVND
ncbi:hypothetical protein GYA19_00200 [Candidatus Beckwithbacteria bacterium]|nr:hypothetical protein [Candidatus Beckwithbacteria bacterium]